MWTPGCYCKLPLAGQLRGEMVPWKKNKWIDLTMRLLWPKKKPKTDSMEGLHIKNPGWTLAPWNFRYRKMPIFEAGVSVGKSFPNHGFVATPSCTLQAVAEALTRTFQKAKDWRKNVSHFNARVFKENEFQGCKEDISSPSPYLYAFIVVRYHWDFDIHPWSFS